MDAALLRVILLLACLWAPAAWSTELQGRVVGIHDGDTLTLLASGNQQVRIRLGSIDAPESRQPYGIRAQQELSSLAGRKEARVVVEDIDRYGRTVGRLWVGAVDVNAELVRRGASWVYQQYNRDPALLALEAEAKAAKKGLWALPPSERIAPWAWRGGDRRSSAQERSSAGALHSRAPELSCGAKRYCGQMRDCAEARFYFSQCNVSRLDGDGDGMPCERLCR
ncbi:thermonuclease family protein [Teichococcus aestuarii]|uniref:thermonuclease family protein n=1 Tax=Teichococcus aestuarii TaxID=568898 RepID=UPI0036D3628C